MNGTAFVNPLDRSYTPRRALSCRKASGFAPQYVPGPKCFDCLEHSPVPLFLKKTQRDVHSGGFHERTNALGCGVTQGYTTRAATCREVSGKPSTTDVGAASKTTARGIAYMLAAARYCGGQRTH